jgi:hypothetical protein
MKFVNKLIKEPGPEPLTPSESLLWTLVRHVLGPLGWLFVTKSKSYVAEDYGEWGDADKEEFKRLMDTKDQSGH